MAKRLIIVSAAVLFLFLPRAPALAETVLYDSFINTTLTDLSQTTAYVDTANSMVRLQQQALPNALAMKQFGYGYAVVTTQGIQIMDYDEGANTAVGSYAILEPDALGVSLRQDIPRLWYIKPDTLQQYDFDDSLQTYAPGPMLTGLGKVLSVSAQPLSDQVTVLSRSASGTGVISTIQLDDTGQLQKVPGLSFDTGITDPVAVSVIPNTPDFVLASSTGVLYYAFDDGTGTYQPDPSRSVTGLTGIQGITADSRGFRVLTATTTDYYLPSDTSVPGKVVDLSENPIESSVAVSAGGSYDFARLTSDGTVKYFSYDEGTGTVTEIPELSSTGFLLANQYRAPCVYRSVQRTSARPFNTVRLTVTENNDANTSIAYQVSVDSGATWLDITPGTWLIVPDSTRIILQAVLETADNQYTPRLLDATLEVTRLSMDNLTVSAMALPPAGQPVPTNVFPVFVKAGAEIEFKVNTTGYANQVVATFTGGGTVIMVPANPTDTDTNVWTGTYVIPPNASNGDVYQVIITASSGISGNISELTANPFIIVDGSVLEDLNLMLSQ